MYLKQIIFGVHFLVATIVIVVTIMKIPKVNRVEMVIVFYHLLIKDKIERKICDAYFQTRRRLQIFEVRMISLQSGKKNM